MKISKQALQEQATTTGFKTEILEKVWHLMGLLNKINSHVYLKDRLVLKGGTALNLFLVDLPRLSIDIDLNYIGQLNRASMQEERPKIEEALKLVCDQEGFEMRRVPNRENQGAHAGGKFQFRYDSMLGNRGNLEVDISYMYRTPLWDAQKIKSVVVGGIQTENVLILSTEEIIAGKLSALFTRKAARDLFDVHYLMRNMNIDLKKLKTTFLIYGIMGPKDLRNITLNQVSFDKDEYYQNLVPVLTKDKFIAPKYFNEWANQFEMECQNALKELITFSSGEQKFLDQFYDNGEVDLELITNDKVLANRAEYHPLLLWRKQQLDVHISNKL